MRALLYLFPLFIALSLGCGEYNKVLKSTDIEYKYEKAIEYYEDGKCYQALPILEELIGLVRGTQRAENVYYYHALSHYCVEDFYLANYYLTNFTKNYSYSERAEECQFLAAMCSYQLSPNYSLDQTDTKLAINEMQLFLDKYPSSSLRDSCSNMIGELNRKLERKNYEVALLYVKTEDYRSALVALENALKDFSGSPYREDMMFQLVRSSYLYADQSVQAKKLERYNDCIEHYLNFVALFPESENRKPAEKLYDNSRKEVERLTKSSDI